MFSNKSNSISNKSNSISNINPKSFDMELASDFTNTIKVAVSSIENPNTELKFSIFKSSLNNSENVRTILFDDSTLLEVNKSYKVVVSDNGVNLLDQTILVEDFPAIINADVRTYGNRIIEVVFPYPVKNLAKLEPNGTKNLNNFYSIYFNRDVIGATTQPNAGDAIDWKGYFTIDADEKLFTATVSPDQKSIEIQSNIKNLPIGDTHSLTINYTRLQGSNVTNKNFILVDYSKEEREIPIMEKPFSLRSEQYPAKAVSIIPISLTEFIVNFDKEVLLRKEDVTAADGSNIGYVMCNGVSKEIDSRERVGSDKKSLKYTLKSTTPLTAGTDVELVVSPITDASGFTTKAVPLTATIIAVPPTLDSISQDTSNPTSATTKINLKYSWNMNTTSAKNIGNYVLNNTSLTDPITITSVNNSTDPTNEFVIETAKLPAGNYTLCVSNVTDIFGIPIVDVCKTFDIVDLTVPTVEKILMPDSDKDVILVMFDGIMNVSDQHGANVATNYRLIETPGTTDPIPLSESIKIDSLNSNKWMRINLSSKFDATVNTSAINIGYARLRDIIYVTNQSGNIFPICKESRVTALVPELDIAGGSMSILSDSSLKFTASTSSEFMFNPSMLSPADFKFTKNSNTTTPISVVLSDDYKNLTFTFPSRTFESSITTLDMTTTDTVTTTDIFGKKIKASATCNTITSNMLSARLVRAYRESQTTGTPFVTLTIGLLFDNEINKDSVTLSDFAVRTANEDDNKFMVLSKAELSGSDTKTILLTVESNTLNLSSIPLSVSTTKEQDKLLTKDAKGNPITPFKADIQ
ncbi:hypothetical protein [Clostridium sardiniense]|uniref:hypothetical protein n=1 Tax=Clostridium sardiniense TaxID=29369 RepID=UPI003D330D44